MITCTKQGGYRHAHMYTLGNLPSTTRGELQQFLKSSLGNKRPVEIVRMFPPPFEESAAHTVLRGVLERYGTVQSFDVKASVPSEGNNKALAIFSNREEAQQAVDNLHGTCISSLGNYRVFFDPLFSTLIPIHKSIYSYVKDSLSVYLTAQTNVSFSFLEQNASFMKVKVKCNDGMNLANIARHIRTTLQGSSIIDEVTKKEYWHTLFAFSATSAATLDMGTELLNRIGAKRNVFIYCDRRRKQLCCFGLEKDSGDNCIAVAILADIRDDIALYEKKMNTIHMTKQQFSYLVRVDKAYMLRVSGATSVSFSAMNSCAVVTGSLSSVDKIKRMLADQPLGPSSGESAVTSSGEYHAGKSHEQALCVVCFCDYDSQDLVSLPACGHSYCKECFPNWLTHAKTSGDFPLLCVASQCKCPIELTTLQEVSTSQEDLCDLVKASFQHFINHNGERYRWCHTPNCEQVYSVDSGVTQCNMCAACICTDCKSCMHEGLTCIEYSQFRHLDPTEAAFAQWKKRHDVRTCPKKGCGASIEKSGGCNHMQCSKCSSHICWVCMKIYLTSQKVYDHMCEKHGSIGL
jgi:hypothetical protein